MVYRSEDRGLYAKFDPSKGVLSVVDPVAASTKPESALDSGSNPGPIQVRYQHGLQKVEN